MERPVEGSSEAKAGGAPSSSAADRYRELHRVLASARRRAARRVLAQGLARVGGALLAAVATALLVLAVRPGGWGPPIAAAALGAVALIALAALVLAPLCRLPSVARYTRQIDEHFREEDGDANEFLSALELGRQPVRRGTSDSLVGALVGERAAAAVRLDLEEVGRRPLQRRWRTLPGVAAIVLLGLVLVAPGRFAANVTDLLHPDLPQPATVVVRSLTGDLSVERGSGATVVAEVTGTDREPSIRVRRGAGVWRTFGMVEPETAGAGSGRIETAAVDSPSTGASARRYRFTIATIDQETHYRVTIGDASSAEYRITVIEPLRIVGFELGYDYPDYARLESETVQAGDGQVAALRGTRVEVTIETNRDVEDGTIEIADGAIRALELLGSHRARGTLVVTDAASYTLRLRRRGAAGAAPGREAVFGPYAITPSPDRDPLVALLEPADDIDVPRDLVIALTVHAADDYGLSSLYLHYSYEGAQPVHRQLSRFTGYPREITETYTWSLADLNLLPGDLVTYYLEVYDNDTVSGPKRARTRTYTLRFPTMAELYAEVEEVHGQSQEELEEALERSEELQRNLEEIAREMKKFPEATWEDRQEIQRAFERQQELREKIADVADSLGESLERLENQELVNDDVLEKLSEIQRLVEQITDPELQEAMRKLGESLSQLDQSEIQRALSELQMTQEDLLRSLEKTIEMLEQVQAEEKMEAAIQLAEQMLEQQETVNEGLEDLDDEDAEPDAGDEQGGDEQGGDEQGGDEQGGDEQASDEQASDAGQQSEDGSSQDSDAEQSRDQELMRLSELEEETLGDAEALSQLLDELSELLEQQSPEAAAEMERLAEQAEPGQPLQMDMQQALQQMAQQNPQGAQRSGQNASQKLQSMLASMRTQQMMMGSQMALEAAEKLREAARDLLWISENEEGLLVDEEPASHNRLAERQLRLLEGTRKVNEVVEEVARTSMMVGTSFAGILGRPMRSMENATRSFERANKPAGRLHAYQALAQVNESILELLEQEQQMFSAAGSCSSMKSGLQKMMGLSQQQQQVNQGTLQLLQQQQGGRMSEGARQRLARLAAQQRMIQKGVAEAAQSLDQRRDVLGRLGDLASEMEQLAEEMQRSELDERVVRRQQRFLTRLLDAQRSIRKRDLGRERQSRTGAEVAGRRPQALPEDLLSVRERLEADILRGRSDLYPPEYREIVERYFRALAETGSGAADRRN